MLPAKCHMQSHRRSSVRFLPRGREPWGPKRHLVLRISFWGSQNWLQRLSQLMHQWGLFLMMCWGSRATAGSSQHNPSFCHVREFFIVIWLPCTPSSPNCVKQRFLIRKLCPPWPITRTFCLGLSFPSQPQSPTALLTSSFISVILWLYGQELDLSVWSEQNKSDGISKNCIRGKIYSNTS